VQVVYHVYSPFERRNQGRTTGGIIYWPNIPKAMIVAKASDGQFDSTNMADCSTARLE
jgi:hypothetical protein